MKYLAQIKIYVFSMYVWSLCVCHSCSDVTGADCCSLRSPLSDFLAETAALIQHRRPFSRRRACIYHGLALLWINISGVLVHDQMQMLCAFLLIWQQTTAHKLSLSKNGLSLWVKRLEDIGGPVQTRVLSVAAVFNGLLVGHDRVSTVCCTRQLVSTCFRNWQPYLVCVHRYSPLCCKSSWSQKVFVPLAGELYFELTLIIGKVQISLFFRHKKR